MDIEAHIGPLGIDVRTHPSFLTEAVRHRILDFERGKVEAGQGAVLGGDVDLECVFGGEPHLPSHRAGGLIQVALVAVRGLRELHQNPLRQTAAQIELHGLPPGSHGHDAASPHQQIVADQAGDVVDLMGKNKGN